MIAERIWSAWSPLAIVLKIFTLHFQMIIASVIIITSFYSVFSFE